jgi:hypothetical protein
MNIYTEDQLKRAFECGASVGVGLCMDEEHNDDPAWDPLSDRHPGCLFNRPQDIHRMNMQLFLWSRIDWSGAFQWILNPAPPVFQKKDTPKKYEPPKTLAEAIGSKMEGW